MTAGRRLALTGAVFAAPVAWAAQLVIAYSVEEGGCSVAGPKVAGVDVANVAGVVSLIALAVAVAGGLTALVLLRRRDESADPRGVVHFLAGAAAMAAVIFSILIVFGGVATIVLDPCSAG